jgi:predicted outer membrane repeat protein
LTQGEILVQHGVTLSGPGTSSLRINGTGAHRIFTIATAGFTNIVVNLSGLTFTNGASGSVGGAFLIQPGGLFNTTVNLSNCVLVANFAQFGGVIDNDGTLNIQDCVLSENTSSAQGGVIYNFDLGVVTIDHSTLANNQVSGDGGVIWNNHTVNISASTFSGNSATGDGGVIESTNGTVTIINSTISSNQATGSGGAIVNGGTLDLDATTIAFNHANDAGGVENLLTASLASVINTIIASNTAVTANVDVKGVFDSQGDNLISNTNGATGWAMGDLINVDPKLGPLQDNGGTTFTHMPLTNSPALDAGDDANRQPADQRDVPRPQGKRTDIGAVETSLRIGHEYASDHDYLLQQSYCRGHLCRRSNDHLCRYRRGQLRYGYARCGQFPGFRRCLHLRDKYRKFHGHERGRGPDRLRLHDCRPRFAQHSAGSTSAVDHPFQCRPDRPRRQRTCQSHRRLDERRCRRRLGDGRDPKLTHR